MPRSGHHCPAPPARSLRTDAASRSSALSVPALRWMPPFQKGESCECRNTVKTTGSYICIPENVQRGATEIWPLRSVAGTGALPALKGFLGCKVLVYASDYESQLRVKAVAFEK